MTKDKGDRKAVQITPDGKREVSLLDVTSLLVRQPRDQSTARFISMMGVGSSNAQGFGSEAASASNYSTARFAANYAVRLKQAQDRALRDALPDPELDAFFANDAEEPRAALTPEQIERVLGRVPPNLSSIYNPVRIDFDGARRAVEQIVKQIAQPKQPTDEVEDRMRAVFDGLDDNQKGD